jgi:aminoglycoside phosphotransferase (APT) family kinase protein
MPSGEQVVVKIQATHGQLQAEEAALRYLAPHGPRVPRVVSFGTDADGACFLVLSREPGVRPTEPGGWYRLGRDLAALPQVPVDDCTLRRTTAAEFVAEHLERLDVVTALLGGKTRRATAAAIRQFEVSDRLVLTHGDPGSGNYLEQHDQGVILDWETASVGPYGVDAGRAAFIALLDNGHTGIPEELHAAVVCGYHDGLPADCALDQDTLSAATIVAGLQFIHGRHVEPLRPDRTPRIAIDVLAAYLGIQ